MAPGADWKLYLSSPAGGPSHSTHDSLEDALTAACSFAMVPHQTALRIEGPTGEKYDQAHILDECARPAPPTDVKNNAP